VSILCFCFSYCIYVALLSAQWGGSSGIEDQSLGPLFLQCFDTVGWVFWPIKPIPNMTYNVLGGTLNLAQFNSIGPHLVRIITWLLWQCWGNLCLDGNSQWYVGCIPCKTTLFSDAWIELCQVQSIRQSTLSDWLYSTECAQDFGEPWCNFVWYLCYLWN